jgi:MYXO-CTERM domain-containing protein
VKRLSLLLLLLSAGSSVYAGAVTCSVSGTLMYLGASDSAVAKFTPANGSLSTTAAACLGTGAYFNWYQVVTTDTLPPGAAAPYIDPQSGGNQPGSAYWRDSLPWYYDSTAPPGGISVCPPGTAGVGCYSQQSWQIMSPCITYTANTSCPAYPTYTPASDFIMYSDQPSSPQTSIQLAFETRLVVVSADSSQWAYVDGFSWTWSNPGSPLVGVASNFQALSASALVNPPSARQGGGSPPPFDFGDRPEAHSSLGAPVSPLFDTPEPSSASLFSFGLLGLGILVAARRRRSQLS